MSSKKHIYVVGSTSEANFIASMVDKRVDNSVVYIGEYATLDVNPPKWWINPRLVLPSKKATQLLHNAVTDGISKIYISLFDNTLRGKATAYIIIDMLISFSMSKNINVPIDNIYTLDNNGNKLPVDLTSLKNSFLAFTWMSVMSSVISKRIDWLVNSKFGLKPNLSIVSMGSLAKILAATSSDVSKQWVVSTTIDGIEFKSEKCQSYRIAERYANAIRKGVSIAKRSHTITVEPPSGLDIFDLIREAYTRWKIPYRMTMDGIAKLYKSGAITYPWTYGTHVPDWFRTTLRTMCSKNAKYKNITIIPRSGNGGVAILPTTMERTPKINNNPPRSVNHTPVEHIYAIIWERAGASQMAPMTITRQQARLSLSPDNDIPMSKDRLLGVASGIRIIDPGFSTIWHGWHGAGLRDIESISTSGNISIEIAEVHDYVPVSEHDIISSMINMGVSSHDALDTIRELWDSGYITAHPDGGVKASPLGEAIIHILRMISPMLVDPAFISKIYKDAAIIANGRKDGHEWVKGFVTRVLNPRIEDAIKTLDAVNVPQCPRTLTKYRLDLGVPGAPVFVNDVTGDIIPAAVRNNEFDVYKSVPTNGLCNVCHSTDILVSRSATGQYIHCAHCGNPNISTTR